MKVLVSGAMGGTGRLNVRDAVASGHSVVAPVRAKARSDARKSLGPFADALALDQTVSGQHARRVLALKPHGPGLIADLSVRKRFQQINGA